MQNSDTPNAAARAIVENVSKVIVGKTPVVEQALAALIAQGHILVEDVPGVGRPCWPKACRPPLAVFSNGSIHPGPATKRHYWVSVYNQRSGEFEFRPDR